MTKIASKFLVCACRASDGSPAWTRVVRAEIVKADDVESAKVRILRDRLVAHVFDLADSRHIAALLIAGSDLIDAAEEAPSGDGEYYWDHIAKMSAQGHLAGSFVAGLDGMVTK